jgi:hypothetical protein
MNITEMHYNFKLKLNKVASNLNPNLNQAEIDEFLNIAIREFVESVYDQLEVNQKAIDMLGTLVIKSPEHVAIKTPTDLGNGIYKYDLSSLDYDYLHLINVNAITESCNGKTIDVDIVSHNELDEKLSSTIYGPSLKWNRMLGTVGREASGTTSLYVYTNGLFEITGLHIDYIKMPVEVAISNYNDINGVAKTPTDCDINSMYHDTIIDIAVQKAYKALLLTSNSQQ